MNESGIYLGCWSYSEFKFHDIKNYIWVLRWSLAFFDQQVMWKVPVELVQKDSCRSSIHSILLYTCISGVHGGSEAIESDKQRRGLCCACPGGDWSFQGSGFSAERSCFNATEGATKFYEGIRSNNILVAFLTAWFFFPQSCCCISCLTLLVLVSSCKFEVVVYYENTI